MFQNSGSGMTVEALALLQYVTNYSNLAYLKKWISSHDITSLNAAKLGSLPSIFNSFTDPTDDETTNMLLLMNWKTQVPHKLQMLNTEWLYIRAPIYQTLKRFKIFHNIL